MGACAALLLLRPLRTPPAHPPSPCSSAGSAATWNLTRLDALAAEVTARFYAACHELGVAGSVETARGAAADSVLLTLHMDLVRSFPVQLISAVNDVLFTRHGYTRMLRHGDAANVLLSTVLERGSGSPGGWAGVRRGRRGRCRMARAGAVWPPRAGRSCNSHGALGRPMTMQARWLCCTWRCARAWGWPSMLRCWTRGATMCCGRQTPLPRCAWGARTL